MIRERCAEVLVGVPKHRKAVTSIGESTCVREALPRRLSGLQAVSSVLVNEQYVLSKVSLNRSTWVNKFYVGPLMKMRFVGA